jgi:heme exporter protein C
MTRALGWLAAVGLGAGLVMAFGVAPREATQGNVQRIMYLHVPSVWIAYVAFAVVFVASIVYLARRAERADHVAHASAELGVLFTGLTIATGSIWGKPTWGAWWTWDARLTSTLFLWFIILAYLMLRGAVEDRARRARYSAVLGILAALLIPFIHLSVYLFRTLHPMPILLKPSTPSMPPEMRTTFLLAFVAFSLLFVALIRVRYRVATLRDLIADREEGIA